MSNLSDFLPWGGDTAEIGDIRFSVDQPGPGFIRTGQRYLQSAYPELFARIGIRPSFPKTTAAGAHTNMSDCERSYYLEGQFFQNSATGSFYRWNSSTSLWETLAIPTTPVRRWLAVGGGFAVAGAAPPTAWSRATGAITSATTWTNITGPGTNVPLRSLLFHNGEFFAFKDDGVFASANGTAWSARTTVPGGGVVSGVVSFQGKLLAMSSSGGLWVSEDNAVAWEAVALPASATISHIFALDGEVVAISPTGTGFAYSTADFVTWGTFPIGRWSRTSGIFGASLGCVIGIGDASNKTLEFSFQDGMFFEVNGSWPGTTSYRITSTDDGSPPMLTSYDSVNGRMHTQFIHLHDYDKATQFFVPPVITVTGAQSWIKAEAV